MKNVLMSFVLLLAGLYVVKTSDLSLDFRGDRVEKTAVVQSERQTIGKMRLVCFSDITSSTKSYGVEMMTSQSFKPIFACTDRDIDLSYGVISRSSARKLITVNLPAFKLVKPVAPDLTKYSITQKAQVAEEYERALAKYQYDSITYYRDRSIAIEVFTRKVDSLNLALNVPSEQGSTDVITAIDIADKAFNVNDGAENYLVLNSDGMDNQSSDIAKLNNKAIVLLINAGKYHKTPVDGIEPIGFQSSEHAIQFILNNKNVSYGK